jgi:hypothetical protein
LPENALWPFFASVSVTSPTLSTFVLTWRPAMPPLPRDSVESVRSQAWPRMSADLEIWRRRRRRRRRSDSIDRLAAVWVEKKLEGFGSFEP